MNAVLFVYFFLFIKNSLLNETKYIVYCVRPLRRGTFQDNIVSTSKLLNNPKAQAVVYFLVDRRSRTHVKLKDPDVKIWLPERLEPMISLGRCSTA